MTSLDRTPTNLDI